MADANQGSLSSSGQKPTAPDLNKQEVLLAKRAKNLAGSLKLFLADWHKATAIGQGGTALPAKQAQGKQQKAGMAGKAAAKASPSPSKFKKSAPKDPKDEALAKLMQDLDEKINKAKKCKLEDMYNAVATLEGQDQHVLSSILSAYGSKLLGEKQANEASMTIRDTLCAAAAAHNYHRPQSPEPSKSSAAAFRQQGLPAHTAVAAGFTAGQLLRGGYSTAELVQSGAPLDKLRAAGISVSDLYSSLPADQAAQLTGPAGAAKLKAAGYTVAAVQEGATAGAFSPWDLKLAGYAVTAGTPEPVPAAAGGLSPRNRFSAAALQLKKQQSVQQRQQEPQQQLPLQQQQQLQGQQGKQQAVVGPRDVQYFRHQIMPLVQMKTEQDVPPLLLGMRVPSPVRFSAAAACVPLAASYGGVHSNPSRIAARTSSSTSRTGPKIKWNLGEEQSSKQQQAASAEVVGETEAGAADAGVPCGTVAPSEQPRLDTTKLTSL